MFGALITMMEGPTTINLAPGATNNYDMFAAAGSPGYPVIVTCTINSNIGSSSTASPAFTTGTGWAPGCTLTVINNAIIAGATGATGATGSTGAAGSDGSPGSTGSNGAGGASTQAPATPAAGSSGGAGGAPTGVTAGGDGGPGGDGAAGGVAFEAQFALTLVNNAIIVRGAGGGAGSGGSGGTGGSRAGGAGGAGGGGWAP